MYMISTDISTTQHRVSVNLMQPRAPLQILPRASRECRLLVIIQPTVSFFIAQSLAADTYCTFSLATDKSDPMFEILLAVVKGFAKEDEFTSGMGDPAALKDLLAISPQQVLPFTMDWTAPAKRHLIPPKLQGSLKTLVMLTQVMQLAVESFAHLKPEALQAQAQQICNPTQEQLLAARQRAWPAEVSLEEDAAAMAAEDEVPVAVPARASAAAAAEAAAAAADSHDSEISKVPHANLMQVMADMHVDCEAGEHPL